MKLDELCVNTIRMLSIDGVERAKSGHPGAPMGDAAMAYVLWTRHLRHNPANPGWVNRDRFVLSAGHASMLLYSMLHLTGYRLPLTELKRFRQWGSLTPGHPELDPHIGVETTTGPLGQGFGNGVGMAMAGKYLSGYFNRRGFPLFDYHVYGILSDGDLMEGVASEAASLAGHLGLGRIVYLYSDNRITIDGPTDISFTEDRGKRFEAYGWHVQHVDGLDLKGIDKAIQTAKKERNRPSIIIARTHIGYGSPNKHDSPAAHGAPLGPDEVKLVREKLDWPVNRPFHVPKAALARFRKAVPEGRDLEARWNELAAAYRRKHNEEAKQLKFFMNKQLPEAWQTLLPEFAADGKLATRAASGKVLNAIAPGIPMLIGGSADLAASNNTDLKGFGEFETGKAGRNIRFGVREHGMGSIMNGMALSGIIPYGGTFLIFSDYMRPSIRLAALMKQKTVYVLTHDSIGLGEDGPTHQPVEHLASLRAMPNLDVIRPADANEVSEAWRMALERSEGPTALVLTRQGLPVINRRKYASSSGVRRGAYVLADSSGKRPPQLILIATGSEVHLALSAFERLTGEGLRVRVVNMPCTEVFERQSAAYREKVLPAGVKGRIAIEAGSPFGWERYAGTEGIIMGINRFGASAPGGVNFEKFGYTADNVVKQAYKIIKKG